MNSNFTIRVEEPRDFKTVENLTRDSFWNIYRPGCTEHYVLHCFRNNPDFIEEPAVNYFAAGFLFLNINPKIARTRGPATSSCQKAAIG